MLIWPAFYSSLRKGPSNAHPPSSTVGNDPPPTDRPIALLPPRARVQAQHSAENLEAQLPRSLHEGAHTTRL